MEGRLSIKKISISIISVTLALAIAGCEDGSAPTEGTTGEGFINREVILSEYTIEPARIRVGRPRTVRFIVKNDGSFTHEFRVLVDPPVSIEVPPQSKDRL